jgi:hypothetical protein
MSGLQGEMTTPVPLYGLPAGHFQDGLVKHLAREWLRHKTDGTESLGFKHHLLAFRTAHHDDRQRRPSFSHLSQ